MRLATDDGVEVSRVRAVTGGVLRALGWCLEKCAWMLAGGIIVFGLGTYYVQAHFRDNCAMVGGPALEAVMAPHGLMPTADAVEAEQRRHTEHVRKGIATDTGEVYQAAWLVCPRISLLPVSP